MKPKQPSSAAPSRGPIGVLLERVTSNGVTGKRVTAKNTEGKFLRKRVTAKNTDGKFLRKRVTAKNNDRRFSRKRVTN